MKARNDENLEGIQSLARGLGRLLPKGGARGEAIAELQAHTEAAERERDNAVFYEGRTAATLAAVRKWRERFQMEIDRTARDELDAILDGKGEK